MRKGEKWICSYDNKLVASAQVCLRGGRFSSYELSHEFPNFYQSFPRIYIIPSYGWHLAFESSVQVVGAACRLALRKTISVAVGHVTANVRRLQSWRRLARNWEGVASDARSPARGVTGPSRGGPGLLSGIPARPTLAPPRPGPATEARGCRLRPRRRRRRRRRRARPAGGGLRH